MKIILSMVVVLAGIGLIYYLSKNSKFLALLPLQTDKSSSTNKKATGTQKDSELVGDNSTETAKKTFPTNIKEKELKPDYTQPIEPVIEPLTPKQNILVRIFNNKRKDILPPQELPYIYDEEGILVPNGRFRA